MLSYLRNCRALLGIEFSFEALPGQASGASGEALYEVYVAL